MVDITTALAGPSEPKRGAGLKRKRSTTDDAGPSAPTADGDDDDERAIQHAMSWKAHQDGAAATATLSKAVKVRCEVCVDPCARSAIVLRWHDAVESC